MKKILILLLALSLLLSLAACGGKAEEPVSIDVNTLYESYGENGGDVIILGIAAPNYGQEGSVSDIKEFLGDNGYTFPVVMNSGGSLYNDYGISSFPTTIMIDSSGNVYGRAVGGLSYSQMESIIKQTQAG